MNHVSKLKSSVQAAREDTYTKFHAVQCQKVFQLVALRNDHVNALAHVGDALVFLAKPRKPAASLGLVNFALKVNFHDIPPIAAHLCARHKTHVVKPLAEVYTAGVIQH